MFSDGEARREGGYHCDIHHAVSEYLLPSLHDCSGLVSCSNTYICSVNKLITTKMNNYFIRMAIKHSLLLVKFVL